MAVAQQIQQRPVGELLRQWREHRRLSQLALSLDAEISTRHLGSKDAKAVFPGYELNQSRFKGFLS